MGSNNDDLIDQCLMEMEQDQLVVDSERSTIVNQQQQLANRPRNRVVEVADAQQQGGVRKRKLDDGLSENVAHLPQEKILSNNSNSAVGIELMRHWCMGELSKLFMKEVNKLGLDQSLRMPTFERWLIDCKLQETLTQDKEWGNGPTNDNVDDPVLPCSAQLMGLEGTQNLIKEVSEALLQETRGKDSGSDSVKTEAKATEIATHLCEKSRNYVLQQIQNERQRLRDLKKPPHILLEKNGNMCSLIYNQRNNKKPFIVKINKEHYNKLRGLYDENSSIKEKNGSTATSKKQPKQHLQSEFHRSLFCLLLRYSSLAGGQLLVDHRGGGMQGSIHTEVFHVLLEIFNKSNKNKDSVSVWELFASPINQSCGSDHYCSAYDGDGVFGSYGNFFRIPIGFLCDKVCEVNPPFCPYLMHQMARRLNQHLQHAEDLSKRLSILVIVPTYHKKAKRTTVKHDNSIGTTSRPDFAKDGSIVHELCRPSFRLLKRSKFCRVHIHLRAREHGYIEGAQHLKATKYKQSPWDTSVFLLQTLMASQQTSVDPLWKEAFVLEVENSFKSKHQ